MKRDAIISTPIKARPDVRMDQRPLFVAVGTVDKARAAVEGELLATQLTVPSFHGEWSSGT